MQVQLPHLNGQKALDHVGTEHQLPQRDSVLGDFTVKVAVPEESLHMRDGQHRGGAQAEGAGQMDDPHPAITSAFITLPVCH